VEFTYKNRYEKEWVVEQSERYGCYYETRKLLKEGKMKGAKRLVLNAMVNSREVKRV